MPEPRRPRRAKPPPEETAAAVAASRAETERLEARVRDLEEELRLSGERLKAHEDALQRMTEAFHLIESSLTYRVSSRLRRAVNRYAPKGTARGNLAAAAERALHMLVVFGPRAFLAHLPKLWVWGPKLLRGDPREAAPAAEEKAGGKEAVVGPALQGAYRRARDLQRAHGWSAVGRQVLRPGVWAPKLRASLSPKAATRGRPNEPARPLSIPRSSAPAASIVVCAHNQSLYTYNCLKALAENSAGVAFEVIVVDDGSTDDTPDVLGRVENLRVVRLPENAGFIAAANAGAAAASAGVIIFLDNDTQPQAGWLAALLGPFADPGVAIVGAKLVDPNGRLQAAGGVVTRDGYTLDDGRGQDPALPLYNYRRDADYCSASCLAVGRAVFEEAGGFDTAYAPAFYEDVELAFRARSLGYRVVYQPDARVVHFEGVSHGRDTAHGMRRYQEINRLKFAERWRGALTSHGDSLADEAGVRRLLSDPVRERERGARGRVLVADYTVPTFDRDSGSLRMYRLLLQMRQFGLAVTFVPHDATPLQPYTDALREAGIEVVHGVPEVAAYLASRAPFDVAFLSRPEVARGLIPSVRRLALAPKVIYDTVDLHFLREERRAAVEGSARTRRHAAGLRDVEIALVKAADATLVVSEAEERVLKDLLPEAPVHLLPNVHVVREDVPGPEGREGLLFVGNFQHDPNVDAARFLATEIMPRVRRELPDAGLTIVGQPANSGIGALAGEGVRVTGWVPDVEPYLRSAKVFAGALRFGAGTSGKLGESMAAGLPGVTSSLIAEAMGLRDGVEALVADDAEAFAAAVVRLYRDHDLWRALSAAGREYIRRELSPERAAERLATILSAVGLEVGPVAARSAGQ
jgi:GT2 family glycosyltransferase